jgi:predicted nucleic acid-binding protein
MNLVSRPGETLFLDANVLVSAAWKQDAEIALIWQMKDARLITSGYVMGEVQRNLHQVSQIERLRALMRSVRIVSFDYAPDLPEAAELPEKDRPVLSAAVQSQADHLVSGDKKHFGPWCGKRIRGVRITAPTELLALLRQALPEDPRGL